VRQPGASIPGEDAVAGIRAWPKHHGAGGVAEEDTRGPVRWVGHPGQHIAADDQHRLELAALQQMRADQYAEHSACAGGLGEIERDRPLGSQLLLDNQRGRRERLVRRGRRQYDRIEIPRVDPAGPQRLLRRLDAYVRGCSVGLQKPALHNAGVFADPGVASVQHGLEVGVGHDIARHTDARAQERHRQCGLRIAIFRGISDIQFHDTSLTVLVPDAYPGSRLLHFHFLDGRVCPVVISPALARSAQFGRQPSPRQPAGR
jgi:hypothetical protein